MKTPEIERRPANSVAEIEEALRDQLGRDDLDSVQLGEGPGRIIVTGRQARRCGDCEFCCTAAGINELEKAPMVRCPLLARRPGRGCSVHGKTGFPKSCEGFVCGWLIGNFENRHRPDKIGAYVSFFLTPERGFYAIVQCETKRLDRKRLGEVVAALQRYVPSVQIISDDKKGVLLEWGQKPRRFDVMPRPPGEYEVLPFMFTDDA